MSKNGWVTISAIASRPGEIRVTIDSKNPKLEKNEFSDQVPYHYRMYYEASLRDMGTLKADFTNRMQAAGKYLGADRFSCTVAEAAQTIRHLAGANILAEYGGTDSYEKEFVQQRELTKQRIKAINLLEYPGIRKISNNEQEIFDKFNYAIGFGAIKDFLRENIGGFIFITIIILLIKNKTEFLDSYLKDKSLSNIINLSLLIILYFGFIDEFLKRKTIGYNYIRFVKTNMSILITISLISIAISIGIEMDKYNMTDMEFLKIFGKVFEIFLGLFLMSFLYISGRFTFECEKYNIEPGKKDCDFCQEPLLPSQMLADNYDAKKLWQCPKCGQRVIADSYRIIATSGVSLNKNQG